MKTNLTRNCALVKLNNIHQFEYILRLFMEMRAEVNNEGDKNHKNQFNHKKF